MLNELLVDLAFRRRGLWIAFNDGKMDFESLIYMNGNDDGSGKSH